jgi:signal transduction histidine kinase
MRSDAPGFRRRSRFSRYMREALETREPAHWEAMMKRFEGIDLRRHFRSRDQRIRVPDAAETGDILRRMGKLKPEDELNCGACGYDSCREHAAAIHKGLAESEMCLPYTIDRLNRTVDELAQSNRSLAQTQEALMQSERLASMGQLAAGVAHEVNNPLGVLLMYAHLLLDELDEKNRMREDVKMIAEQADRCRKIVAGLLNFARQSRVRREPTDMRELAESCRRCVVRPDTIEFRVRDDMSNPVASIDADQFLQVLTNLVSNAYHAMPDGGVLEIVTRDTPTTVIVEVRDTGTGIEPDIRGRIFEPFFTTKQMGKGTGLGLAVAYGIVKMHRGTIAVESNHDPALGPTGSVFRVEVPREEEG